MMYTLPLYISMMLNHPYTPRILFLRLRFYSGWFLMRTVTLCNKLSCGNASLCTAPFYLFATKHIYFSATYSTFEIFSFANAMGVRNSGSHFSCSVKTLTKFSKFCICFNLTSPILNSHLGPFLLLITIFCLFLH